VVAVTDYSATSNGRASGLYSGVDDIGDGTDEAPLACIDIADLEALDLPEVRFLVDYLLPEVGLVLLSGDSGAGKTAFMDHAGLAIGLGQRVGGTFATLPDAGPVLYLNGEIDPALPAPRRWPTMPSTPNAPTSAISSPGFKPTGRSRAATSAPTSKDRGP
jgi:hypothetical protein